MLAIDSAVLNVTERACQRFQRLTGRTNVWLAFQLTNLSIVVYFLWAAALWMAPGAPRLFLALFSGVLLYMLTQTVFKVPVETYETSAFQRVAKSGELLTEPSDVHVDRTSAAGVLVAPDVSEEHVPRQDAGRFLHLRPVQEHQIDIGIRSQFPAPVPA